MDEPNNKNFLHSVDSALLLMDLFETFRCLSLTEISKKLGIGKSTAFRLCSTLEHRGYLAKREDAKYILGMRFLSLGAVATDRMELGVVLRPLLVKLMEETEETVHLVVWADYYRVVLIDHVLGPGSIRVVNDVRAPRYPHSTSTGMSLLAEKSDEYIDYYLKTVPLTQKTSRSFHSPEQVWDSIKEIRHNGYAINDQKYELGLVSISVPIFNKAHQPLAAISVSGPDTRIKAKQDLIIQKLKELASEAEQLAL